MTTARTGVLSVSLGAATQASRLALMMVLAHYLDPAAVGTFALATVTVSYAQLLLGADFYTFTTREIPARPRAEWGLLLRTHLAHAALSYRVVLPALLLVFWAGMLPWKHLLYFYLVVVLDHLGQELYRILTSLERPLQAHATFFLRSGAWPCLTIVLMMLVPGARSLTTVWLLWAAGCALGLALCVGYLRDGISWRAALRGPANPAWLGEGTRMGLSFLSGTLALRGITVFDRYILELFTGREIVGVYSLFASVAGGIQLFTSYATTMILYPRLVAAHAQGRVDDFRRLSRQMLLSVGGTAVALAALVGLVLHPLLGRLGSPLYLEHSALLWICLLQGIVTSVALVPQYQLFALRIDAPIRRMNVAAFLVSVAVNVVAIAQYGVVGAALGPLAAGVVMGLYGVAGLRAARARLP